MKIKDRKILTIFSVLFIFSVFFYCLDGMLGTNTVMVTDLIAQTYEQTLWREPYPYRSYKGHAVSTLGYATPENARILGHTDYTQALFHPQFVMQASVDALKRALRWLELSQDYSIPGTATSINYPEQTDQPWKSPLSYVPDFWRYVPLTINTYWECATEVQIVGTYICSQPPVAQRWDPGATSNINKCYMLCVEPCLTGGHPW